MEAQYLELAKRIGLGGSKIIPELFKMVSDLDEADLLLALPGSAPEMAEKFGRPLEEMEKKLQHLFHKGLVFPSAKKVPVIYRACRDLVQFHDATILWPEAPRSFLDRWQDYMEQEWPDAAKAISQMLPRPFTRVIPVGVAVSATTHILAFEDIKEIIEKSRSLAVTKCTCRLIAHKCDKPLEACLQVNNAADYSISRGTGRSLTKKEAMDLLRETEEAGLIHVVVNKQDVDHFICNCCACCCQTFPILIKYGISVVEPSRFAAQVDPDLCTACETCLGRCFFGAITINDIAEINLEKRLGCGLCQVTCPTEAISMKEIRKQDFVPEKMFG
ncbi:MAG: 4Fe-4S binding protein [Pseudomonadota bacterium]